MAKKILLVDDEQDLLDLMEYNLARERFEVNTATSGDDALASIRDERPDLIVLDIMMPGMTGIDVCKRIRDDPGLADLPVLMLTALGEEEHEIVGLEAGADDYLPKPVSPRLLMSRIHALLRRTQPGGLGGEVSASLQAADLLIDRQRYIVVRGEGTEEEERFHLPRKEFELLYVLASSPGRVFSREQLLDQIWGTDVYVMSRTVDVHIRKIREKLGADYIQTVKGVGYRFRE